MAPKAQVPGHLGSPEGLRARGVSKPPSARVDGKGTILLIFVTAPITHTSTGVSATLTNTLYGSLGWVRPYAKASRAP